MIVVWIVAAVVAILALYAIYLFNRFIRTRNRVDNAWSQIDVQLRRRYDLIPNLVETVKGYAAHEREVFEEVARTRSAAAGASGTPAQQAAAEGPFVAALGKLFAVAENYPELAAGPKRHHGPHAWTHVRRSVDLVGKRAKERERQGDRDEHWRNLRSVRWRRLRSVPFQ